MAQTLPSTIYIWNVKSAAVYCNSTVLALPFICFQNWFHVAVYIAHNNYQYRSELLIETAAVLSFFRTEHTFFVGWVLVSKPEIAIVSTSQGS